MLLRVGSQVRQVALSAFMSWAVFLHRILSSSLAPISGEMFVTLSAMLIIRSRSIQGLSSR